MTTGQTMDIEPVVTRESPDYILIHTITLNNFTNTATGATTFELNRKIGAGAFAEISQVEPSMSATAQGFNGTIKYVERDDAAVGELTYQLEATLVPVGAGINGEGCRWYIEKVYLPAVLRTTTNATAWTWS
jgi:hypothetical protein